MLRREDISGVVRIIIVGSWPGKGGGGGSLRGWFDEVTGPCFSAEVANSPMFPPFL